jgi:glutathione S-transferase
LSDGRWLTEGVALLSYIADLKPESGLLPANGSWERYKALEWLTFISTELHKGFSPLWNAATGTADKEAAWDRLSLRIDLVNEQLKTQKFLLGQKFSVADAYAFTVLNWAGMLKRSLERWPAVSSYMVRMRERASVAAVLKAEGIKS